MLARQRSTKFRERFFRFGDAGLVIALRLQRIGLKLVFANPFFPLDFFQRGFFAVSMRLDETRFSLGMSRVYLGLFGLERVFGFRT